MTFDQYVKEQLGPRPSFTHGNYSSECRTWDARFVALLNGGSNEATLPVYHPKRRVMEADE